jgi:hypothetical protein
LQLQKQLRQQLIRNNYHVTDYSYTFTVSTITTKSALIS